MKAVVLLFLSIVILRTKAWSAVRNPFEFKASSKEIHTISDCMHVTSEEGDYFYKKIPHVLSPQQEEFNLVEVANSALAVCGLYVMTDPEKIVEIIIKRMDVDCDSGGLLAFVDGWELNGEYFPSIMDHHLKLEQRVMEFCNENILWPVKTHRWVFRSNQNAALLQYRIPIRGSFLASIRFLPNPSPCHIMAEGIVPFYTLTNASSRGNCTLTVLFPAVVSVISMNIGDNVKPTYDCDKSGIQDKLVIGGSTGLDSYDMENASTICGHTDKIGPEQAIFCGTTSVRLTSSGKMENRALISVRMADESDLSIATLVCHL